jgi:hypothetical protein
MEWLCVLGGLQGILMQPVNRLKPFLYDKTLKKPNRRPIEWRVIYPTFFLLTDFHDHKDHRAWVRTKMAISALVVMWAMTASPICPRR